MLLEIKGKLYLELEILRKDSRDLLNDYLDYREDIKNSVNYVGPFSSDEFKEIKLKADFKFRLYIAAHEKWIEKYECLQILTEVE